MSEIPDEIVEYVARAIILEVASRTNFWDDLDAVWLDAMWNNGENRRHACAIALTALQSSDWLEMRDDLKDALDAIEMLRDGAPFDPAPIIERVRKTLQVKP